MAIDLQAEKLINPPSADVFLESRAITPIPERVEQFAKVFHQFSQRFAEVHEDMIVDDTASILLVGITENGELIDIDKRVDEDALSLNFDSRRLKEGVYGWQLSRANKEGRVIDQLSVTPEKLAGTRYALDHQGKLFRQSKLDELTTKDLAKTIRRLATGQEVLQQTAEFIIRKEKSEREMGRYIIELELKHSPDKYESEIKFRKRQIKEIGFVSLLPYKLPNPR